MIFISLQLFFLLVMLFFFFLPCNNYNYIFNDFIIPVSFSECPRLDNKLFSTYNSGQVKELWDRARACRLGFSVAWNGFYIFKGCEKTTKTKKHV